MLLGGLAAILVAIMVAVVFCDLNDHYGLLGVTTKPDALKFLGIAVGGVLVAIQALASHRRAGAMEGSMAAQADAVKAQTAAVNQQVKANLHTEAGLRQDRLKNAIGHLGADSMSMRLGAAYELFHLASDSSVYCHSAHDILCAHIRQVTSNEEYREQFRTEPSVEIQSLLSLLFIDRHRPFVNISANVCGSYLAGANLRNAELQGADLTGACLSEASLRGALLQGALLGSARLHFANLVGARLQGAILHFADLQCANLSGAQCQGASVYGAQMHEAKLHNAKFHGAKEWIDYVAEAHPPEGTSTVEVGSSLGSRIPGFEERIRASVGTQSQISSATFGGGLSVEMIDRLAACLTTEFEDQFRQKMDSHRWNPPRHRPPDGSGIRCEFRKI
ncbi:MAG: pentapeptide repeat-containing protein [Acidobacteriia bacterium]|nr:pentapeptide repeat-containing protein [Terriglobia bacterium]MYG02548.1 pentapeptide repeat-containing protein [Terriglobia bacterium]MYK08041.1 pentapeptide repeat-containing protein [Terriglobia bacterium]